MGSLSRIRAFLDLIKFEHTIFALPFAYLGMVLAAEGWPNLHAFLWITIAMAAARTLGMGANRLADRWIDTRNPRTAIARTLSLQPDLLLMDEPFASLDAPTREDLQNLTLQLRAETGLTTVVVTHTIEEAALLGAQVLVLGRLPNRAARLIPNPGGADPAFRASPRYARSCARLRRELEAAR
jgi:ABC-type cobalamin transport system ATPase subunit